MHVSRHVTSSALVRTYASVNPLSLISNVNGNCYVNDMDEKFRDALKRWEEADRESKIEYAKLKEIRGRRKAAADELVERLGRRNQSTPVVISYNSQRFRMVESTTRKPLTLSAVRRGLEKCIQSQDDVNALLSVIQGERGVTTSCGVERIVRK